MTCEYDPSVDPCSATSICNRVRYEGDGTANYTIPWCVYNPAFVVASVIDGVTPNYSVTGTELAGGWTCTITFASNIGVGTKFDVYEEVPLGRVTRFTDTDYVLGDDLNSEFDNLAAQMKMLKCDTTAWDHAIRIPSSCDADFCTITSDCPGANEMLVVNATGTGLSWQPVTVDGVVIDPTIQVVANITALQAIDTLTYGGTAVYMLAYATAGDGGHGWFRWSGSNLSAQVTADPRHGIYVPPSSDTTGASGAWVRQIENHTITPEMFGAVGNGTTDDAAAIQGAINHAYGLILRFSGKNYRANSSLTISDRGQHWVGSIGLRAANNGTQITSYIASGGAIVIGTDSGNPWDSVEYDGHQNQVFEDIWLVHGSPDTNLTLDATQQYKAGAYGMRDWRGGHIILRRCGLERFEYNWWGIQSDINEFQDVTSNYSKYGIYAGPRSDQFTCKRLYATFCDTALTVDRAQDFRLESPQIVGCGHASAYAIDIKKGSSAIITEPWLEHLQGYNGTDGIGFIACGINDGYGATTTTCPMIKIDNPFVYTPAAGNAYHMAYLVGLGAAFVEVRSTFTAAGISLANLVAIAEEPSGFALTDSTSRLFVDGLGSTIGDAFYLDANGSGTPGVYGIERSATQMAFRMQGRFYLKRHGGATGAETLYFGTENLAGRLFFVAPTYSTGQTTRFTTRKSWQQYDAMPSSGTWEAGDIAWHYDATKIVPGGGAADYIILGWYRLTTGTGHVLNTDWVEMRTYTGTSTP